MSTEETVAPMLKTKQAFTLIELLIVVAIIAILAAIAVPNFLEAQTRSKVARVKADMRSVSTALESYHIDYNSYPIPGGIYITPPVYKFWIGYAVELSTPVAYIASVNLRDVFNPPGRKDEYYDGTLEYFNLGDPGSWGAAMNTGGLPTKGGYYLCSWGPDHVRGDGTSGAPHGPHIVMYPDQGDMISAGGITRCYTDAIYDPTNGTKSGGDIMYFGGRVPVARVHGMVGG